MNVRVIGMFVRLTLHVEINLVCTPVTVFQDLNGKTMNVMVGWLMAVCMVPLSRDGIRTEMIF